MAPHSVLLPRKSHGQRSLEGCSPWGRWGLDTTEWLHFHFSLSCTGESNGNPLQCSCLENPRDGEPGGLPSMGTHRVGHNWSDLAAAAAAVSYMRASLVAQMVKNLPAVQETQVRSLGQEDPLEKGMATHSSIPAFWKSHGQRSLVDYSSWGCKESDMTKRPTLSYTFSYMRLLKLFNLLLLQFLHTRNEIRIILISYED